MEIQNKIHTRDFDYVNANTNTYNPYGNDYTSGLNTSIDTSSSTLLNNTNDEDVFTDWDESQNVSSGNNDGNFFTRGWASLTERRSNLTEEQKQARRETGLGFLQTGLEAWNIFGKAEEGQSNYNPDYSQQNNNVMGLPSGLVYGVGALAVIGIVVLVVKKSKKSKK